MEDPMPVTAHVRLPLREVELRTSRSSGPGGQHANVTASRVEAVFEVSASQALSDLQKRRIVERLGPRVAATAQDHRSQARNRELALERLRSKLAGALTVAPRRRPTKPTAASRKRRRTTKTAQAQRKARRRPPEAGEH